MSFFVKEGKVYDAFRVPLPGLIKLPDGGIEVCKKGDWFVTDCDNIAKVDVLRNEEFMKVFTPIDRIEGVA